MSKIFILLLTFTCSSLITIAQFAPQAGQTGSTAIHKDSSLIKGWASECAVKRGWMDAADTLQGKTTQGDSSKATGYADADIVSLGDGGEAIFHFDNPVTNGPGFDFAVFENGFLNPLDSNLAYLELASVAVSNNGTDYYSFAAQSHTDTLVQVAGTGEYMDCRKINNLAGKYITYFGTPFDLDELNGIAGLDVSDIKYIRVKDVTGSLVKEYCTFDMNNNKINDPYPTPFPTGGFDLDALAVMHYKYALPVMNSEINKPKLYPNPVTGKLYFRNNETMKQIAIFSFDGQQILPGQDMKGRDHVDLSMLVKGLYLIKTTFDDGSVSIQRFTKL